MTGKDAATVAAVFLSISALSLIVSVGMTFQPGWASGWPGIPKHAVFASFVTTIFAIVSLSGAAALLVVLCYLAERLSKCPYLGWVSFVAGMLRVSIAVWMACSHVYALVHADIVRDWP